MIGLCASSLCTKSIAGVGRTVDEDVLRQLFLRLSVGRDSSNFERFIGPKNTRDQRVLNNQDQELVCFYFYLHHART